jgi:CRP-like cAMP-binding protein
MSDAQLSELVGAMMQRTLAPGATVYRAGEPGDSMFVIEKGECVIQDGEGRTKKCRDGANFGERSLMGSETRALNVTASTSDQLARHIKDVMSCHFLP